MYIVAIHDIRNAEKFWGAIQQAPVPKGMRIPYVLPATTGNRAVCLWEADSLEAVRDLVDATVGDSSKNEFFQVQRSNAQGLPG